MYVCHIVWFEHIFSKFSNIWFHVIGCMKTIILQPFFVCLFWIFELIFFTLKNVYRSSTNYQVLEGRGTVEWSRGRVERYMNKKRGPQTAHSPTGKTDDIHSDCRLRHPKERRNTMARMWEQPRCSRDEWIKKMWCCTHVFSREE